METLQAQALENRIGALAELYPQFKEGTWQTSVEITNDRRTLKDEKKRQELRDTWLYTTNFGMYTIEDNNEFLYFGGREANPIFGNIKEATTQLLKNQNYVPNEEEIKAVVSSVQSGATLKVKLSDLELKGDNDEWRYFEINTFDYDQTLNKTQRALAERVYGQEDDFKENMKMFKDADITTTRIYVLNPEYVKKHVKKGKAIARASRLYDFDDDSDFDADDRNVDNANNALRGVLLEKSAEGGAKTSPLETLAGKGYVAHGDIAVVRQSDVSPEAWALLTQRK